jgi:hypothetical protein
MSTETETPIEEKKTPTTRFAEWLMEHLSFNCYTGHGGWCKRGRICHDGILVDLILTSVFPLCTRWILVVKIQSNFPGTFAFATEL